MVRSISFCFFFFFRKMSKNLLQSEGLSNNLKKAMFHSPLLRISVAIEEKKMACRSRAGKSRETLRSELVMKYI